MKTVISSFAILLFGAGGCGKLGAQSIKRPVDGFKAHSSQTPSAYPKTNHKAQTRYYPVLTIK